MRSLHEDRRIGTMAAIGTTLTFRHVRGEVRFGRLSGRVTDVGLAAHDPERTLRQPRCRFPKGGADVGSPRFRAAGACR